MAGSELLECGGGKLAEADGLAAHFLLGNLRMSPQ